MTQTLTARGIRIEFIPRGGVLQRMEITDDGTTVAPLHHAPWSAAEVPPDAPPHQAWLAGDFLAAPFGAGAQGLAGDAHGRGFPGHKGCP